MQRWGKFVDKVQSFFLDISFAIRYISLLSLSSDTALIRLNFRSHFRIMFWGWSFFFDCWRYLLLWFHSTCTCELFFIWYFLLIILSLIHTGCLLTEIGMIWELFLLIWWSSLILLTLRLIVIINDFWSEIMLLLLLLHLIQCNSYKLFELLNFLINLHVCKVFWIAGCFYLLNLMLNGC